MTVPIFLARIPPLTEVPPLIGVVLIAAALVGLAFVLRRRWRHGR